MRPLMRWAAGDRAVSGQASAGDFSFGANTTVGDGTLQLADVAGELSGTKFRGGLSLKGGERPRDRGQPRQRPARFARTDRRGADMAVLASRSANEAGSVTGSGRGCPAANPTQARASANGAEDAAAMGQDLFQRLRGDDMRVTLRVGELLMPDIPAGKLDARFHFQGGTLDVEQLDFSAADALRSTARAASSKPGSSPTGGVDFALPAAASDSLQIVADLFGLPERSEPARNIFRAWLPRPQGQLGRGP